MELVAGKISLQFQYHCFISKTIRRFFGYLILYGLVLVDANLRKLDNPEKNNLGKHVGELSIFENTFRSNVLLIDFVSMSHASYSCFSTIYVSYETSESSFIFYIVFVTVAIQLGFTCSKVTIETPEQGVKYVHS